jgi:aminoglycoside phosphotransferase (APT) family kinase protein
MTVARPGHDQAALAAACAQVGLDAAGASVIYARSNTVFRLARDPVVARLRYAPGSAEWMARLTASVRVTAWLDTLGFPAVRPLDLGQPVAADGYLVTFWDYLPPAEGPARDVEAVARLLRQLHHQPEPSIDLPVTNPLGSLRADMDRCLWLTESQRSWLASRCDDLERAYAQMSWTLGRGLLHGDAYHENLIHTADGPVLADWDSVSYGPREQDLVPAKMRSRFGEPASDWDKFCAAYGFDPTQLHGLPVLLQMRELRALAAYLRSSSPAAQAEVGRRLADLMTGTQTRPWSGLNLTTE